MNQPHYIETTVPETWMLDPMPEKALTHAAFDALASAWSSQLPKRQYVLLLCEQPRHFLIAFMAAQLAGQTVLLPSNNSAGSILEIVNDYPDCYCLLDSEVMTIEGVDNIFCSQLSDRPANIFHRPVVDNAHKAAIAFTSGSTGKACPNLKTWHTLITGATLAQRRFGFSPRHVIVATVPLQHMYGLETAVMVPMVSGARVLCKRPFFPADICEALTACNGDRILISTPVHLRACVRAGITWPDIDFIISATAPLDQQLLQQVEKAFRAPVFEIYGCTEAGSMASRHPAMDLQWQLYDHFTMTSRRDDVIVNAPHLTEPVVLSDVINITGKGRFELLGRKADLVNIAGKRASLSDLNLKINAIPGVQDAVFIVPENANGASNQRLSALAVAPDLTAAEILAQLNQQIDPVFLPRPLHCVDRLPRNATGKLPRQNVLKMLASLGEKA